MNPRPQIAGIAGILAGIALTCELTFFMTSGWSPEKFSDPAAALALLQNGGLHLRAAAVCGFAGLALTTIFVAGLATRLQPKSPTLATATLYFGLIGVAGHSLVPLSLWIGVPSFLMLAASDQQAALNAWGAFKIVLDGAQGVGSLFMGLSMMATGWAVIRQKALPVFLGWVGIVGGFTTIFILFAIATPLAFLAGMAFFPSRFLTVVFRLWAGNALRKGSGT